jgi:hypothetical protein
MGKRAREIVAEWNAVALDYSPGDSTLYQVVVTTIPRRILLVSEAGEVVEHTDHGTTIVSIPNHGSSYVLGDGWVHWTYVMEHWGLSERSAMAVANLLNAYQGEL